MPSRQQNRAVYHYRPKNRSKEWSIVGKVVLITGANSGIGKATAIELARRGAKRVILACRDLKKAEQAAEEIRQQAPSDKAPATTVVIVRHLDLSSLDSVRRFAAEILSTEKAIHVLINNAGILGPSERTLSVDGYELTFATNHLGPFLLTNLLLDRIKRSGPGRIINVASHATIIWLHSLGFHLFDDPNFEKPTSRYFWSIAYFQTKLANILFTKALHKRLDGTKVSTFSLHPGSVASDVVRDFGYLYRLFFPLFAKTVETGAQTSIYCATEPGIEHLSSGYFMGCQLRNPPNYSDEMVEQLWQLSEKLTALKA